MTVSRNDSGRVSTHCAHCGKRKKPPKVKKHPASSHWEADPFCSSACCRAAHGLVDVRQKPGPKVSMHVHGTEANYTTNKCRCAECRKAAREARAARRREARPSEPPAEEEPSYRSPYYDRQAPDWKPVRERRSA